MYFTIRICLVRIRTPDPGSGNFSTEKSKRTLIEGYVAAIFIGYILFRFNLKCNFQI